MPGSLRSLAILAAGSLLIGFSQGSWLLPIAAWIGPTFVLRYARDHPGWRGFLLVYAASALATFIGFGGIWADRGPIMIASLSVGFGLLWALPYLADRLLHGRLPGFASTLAFPLALATVDFAIVRTSPLGSWGALGFTQYGNLELMQLASVTGMIGIAFLMGWFASVANWTWEHRAVGGVGRGPAVFAAVLAVVFAFGFWRLNLSPTSEATIRVAGITANHAPDLSEAVEEATDLAGEIQLVEAHREAYFRETAREAEAGAQVIIWPEVAGAGHDSLEADLITRAGEVAAEHAIYLAIPLFTFGDEFGPKSSKLIENKLLVFDPSGALVLEHVKYGGRISEGYREQGDGILRTVTTPFGVLGGLICYDLDYPAIVEQAGLNGTGLMLDPSSDWQDIDPTHTYMAVFPAIENGMSVVRQTDGGLSIAVDAYGRVLAQTDFFESTDRTMVAQVPTEHVDTIYTAFGRWFGWLVVIGFVLIVVVALRRPRVAA